MITPITPTTKVTTPIVAKPALTSLTGNVILTQGFCGSPEGDPVNGVFLLAKHILSDAGQWTVQFHSDTLPGSDFLMNFNTLIHGSPATGDDKYILVALASDDHKKATQAKIINLSTGTNPNPQVPLDGQDLANGWETQYNMSQASTQVNNLFRQNTYSWSAWLNSNPTVIIDQGSIQIQ